MTIKNLFRGFRRTKEEKDEPAEKGFEKERWVIAALGNPGEEYARSRHNLGFRVLDRIAKQKGVDFDRRKFKGLLAETEIAGVPAMLVKPQTYYNLSGECISGVLGYFKTPPSRLIVVHDELDLPVGRMKLKQGGSDAGNRGIRSIIESLGTQEFIRIRVGVSRPQSGSENKDYLLRPLSPEEKAALDSAAVRAMDAVEAIIADGLERAMGRFNQRG
jgi:PTH1 family peptidyl-tRNA hydrolase